MPLRTIPNVPPGSPFVLRTLGMSTATYAGLRGHGAGAPLGAWAVHGGGAQTM